MAALGKVTDTAMRAKPASIDRWVSESLGRGRGSFLGRISPSGHRAFYYRVASPDGTRQTVKLGDYDTAGRKGLTVVAGRRAAEALAALHEGNSAHGTAPVYDLRAHFEQQRQDEQARIRAEDEARRQAELEASRRLTVRQLFTRWASVDLAPRTSADGTRTGRKDGGEYTRQQFERHVFPSIGDTAVKDVQRADLMAIFDAQKAAGKMRTANVLLSDLKQMLRFAVLRDAVDRNVLDGVEKRSVGGNETERERVLADAEIRQLVQHMPSARMGARSETAIPLILATACRVGELMNARWEHVDLEAATWYIPAEHSKNQRDHTIHLSAFALDRFRTLHALRERGADGQPLPWVFPNRAGLGPVCIKSFGKQLADRQREDTEQRMSRRSLNTSALTLTGGKWTAHDLRRTAATIMARLGFSGDTIDECLNHIIQSRVTRVYVRDRREADQARAFDALGQHLEGLWAGQPAESNVVPLRVAA